MADAKIGYGEVGAVVASYCYGEPTCGQRAVYELGMTGVPIFNTNNNCSSGSSALMLAKKLVESGSYDCVMALGKINYKTFLWPFSARVWIVMLPFSVFHYCF